ncbi:hypothetical protein ILYODFUR_029416 [Ilyodon furcidens]|uniref:Bcl-2 Bcl-2 homology region 1-3 domain-containing protein n=1 Tax=Ilyodon furcidens TaxID=33524 RepID=A0ABV0T2Y1_9TELE
MRLCCPPFLTCSPPSTKGLLAQDMETQHQDHSHYLIQSHRVMDVSSSLRKVMENLVGDEHFNWGRVASLLAFAGVLARQLQNQKGENPGLDPWKWKQQEL